MAERNTAKQIKSGHLTPESGQSLEEAGVYAAGLVAKARELRAGQDATVEQLSEARRVSVRDMAEEIGISSTFVHQHLKKLGIIPEANSQRFVLNDLVAVRGASGRGARRGAGEPCVRIAVVNFKGGVSKSTTTATLGHYLALKGYRTLLVDVDPQGTLSTLMGLQPDFNLTSNDTLLPYLARNIGSEEDLFRPADLKYAIKPTELSTLSVIPASLSLEQATMLLINHQAALGATGDWFYAEALAEGLTTIEDDFDVILIDCPPNMGPLTTIAATAADALIVPLRPSLPDFASSAQFLSMFGQATQDNDVAMRMIHHRDDITKTYLWTRVLLTQSQGRQADKEITEYVRAAYGARVLGPEFPHMTAVAAAGNRMRTIYDVSRKDVGRDTLRRALQVFDTLGAEIESLISMSRQQLVREAA